MKRILVISIFTLLIKYSTGQSNDSLPHNIVLNGKLFNAIYQQKAGEYKALCLQAFNIARLRVDEIIKRQKGKTKKPLAIITDIDETILDNSPNQAHQSLLGKGYESNAWKEWTDMANADTVPGAYSFLKYASSKGIQIFYITNRKANEKNSTIENLKKFHFPNSDSIHLFPKVHPDSSSKETRRKEIEKNYNVVLLLGDNLSDFSFLFDKQPMNIRNENVNKVSCEFGKRFIVIPNPGYGDWETSLFEYKRLTPLQKDSVIKNDIKTY